MERSVEVATGESVAFRYELAGLGSRFIAVVLDNAIQVTLAVPVVLLLVWWGASPARPTGAIHPAWAEKLAEIVAASLIGLGVVFFFMLFFGYFALFEWLWEGQTPGKRLLGIRVVRDGGFPLDFMSAVVRNLIRIVEVALGYYAVSALCTLLSPRNRRLGDMAAGTLVVREGRYERAPRIRRRAGRADEPLVAELTASERELVRSYAARRSALTARARRDLSAQIAASVRPKLTASFEHLSDDDLLVHLAETALDGS
jgi:uncharacterized RDD family membrane protein YckC